MNTAKYAPQVNRSSQTGPFGSVFSVQGQCSERGTLNPDEFGGLGRTVATQTAVSTV